MGSKSVVLLVENDPDLRDRIGGWLEDAAFDVVACPGPSWPDYSCVAVRGTACPLAQAADIVILDLWLASDSVLIGTSSTQLLSYYVGSGKPVIGISSRQDHSRLLKRFVDQELVLLDWPPERRELAETARAMLDAGPKHGPSTPPAQGERPSPAS